MGLLKMFLGKTSGDASYLGIPRDEYDCGASYAQSHPNMLLHSSLPIPF